MAPKESTIRIWWAAQTDLIKQQTKDDRDSLYLLALSERTVFLNGILRSEFSSKDFGYKPIS
jgi:hypothetical protein